MKTDIHETAKSVRRLVSAGMSHGGCQGLSIIKLSLWCHFARTSRASPWAKPRSSPNAY
jgi:hypothetical protein